MHEQDLAIVKALVPVAWADGKFAEREREVLDALLDAYGASSEERDALRRYAATPRAVDDIPLEDLSTSDRRILLHHAVLLSYADGDYSAQEADRVAQLAAHLRIPKDEADALIESAAAHARRHVARL